MKHVPTCISASRDRERSFHHCGGPVKLVEASLYAGNTLQCRIHIHRLGSPVKHVQACLSANKDAESSFHHCGGPVKLVQSCLCAGNTPY